MIKNDFGPGALLGELKLGNGVDTWIPASCAPCLDNSLVRHELDLSPGNISAKESEASPQLPTEFRHGSPFTVAAVLQRGFMLNAEIMPSEVPMDKVEVLLQLMPRRAGATKITT
jgi:hypothetical protein